MVTTVLFDVDGTLVDSNDAHARAWVTAFAEAVAIYDGPADLLAQYEASPLYVEREGS